MDYNSTLQYLFNSVPMFQQVGGSAYKAGLDTTLALDEHFNHPHRQFRTIHVGGTNGKGSCSHTIAAVLQHAGYRVGLYTSPHLVDFRERIRVNGEMLPESYVIDFVENHRAFFEPLHPSFFELTTAMAFNYFAEQKVDVAVVEVGLGGRLDCTNIIRPDLCVITNISFDHVQFLGDTYAKIAYEKAGIIKTGIPVVVGEYNEETKAVFQQQAEKVGAPIVFAQDEQLLKGTETFVEHHKVFNRYETADYPALVGELTGLCQQKNTNTLLSAFRKLKQIGYRLKEEDIRYGFAHVTETGLMGRWQTFHSNPTVICDTGHNVGGMEYITEQLSRLHYKTLHIVIGMVSDKDVSGVMKLLPKNAVYYFTKASVKRAMSEADLSALAHAYGLEGTCYPTVVEAVNAAYKKSLPDDLIFVGGSSFIVADLLAGSDTLDFN